MGILARKGIKKGLGDEAHFMVVVFRQEAVPNSRNPPQCRLQTRALKA